MSVMSRVFNSSITQDTLEVSTQTKSHNGNLKIIVLDSIIENIKLINNALNYMKMNDIKWIILSIHFKFNIPENTVWFKNKTNGNICIHIEDFEKFYLQNLANFVKSPDVNLFLESTTEDEDGWIKVIDKKKERRLKVQSLLKEINSMESVVKDWSDM